MDTPGTNAIIRSHEALTTHFVPRSDAVLFVTSTERPFSESERAFMARIRQWGKKVVVVLNKSLDKTQARTSHSTQHTTSTLMPPAALRVMTRWDLTQSDEDRERIVQYVRAHVEQELHEPFTLFTVSARQAMQARATASTAELQASGMTSLERWLVDELSSGERMRLKLLSPVNVVGRILSVYEAQLRDREARSEADRRVLDAVNAGIAQFARDVRQQAELEVAKLDSALYDRMARVQRVVASQAVLSNLWSLFRGAWAGEWQSAFSGLDTEVRDVLSALIDRVSECTMRAVADINRTIQRHNQRLAANHSLVSHPTSAASSASGAASVDAPEQSLVPLVDTSALWSTTPSHQQFVQLQQHCQRVLSPATQLALHNQIRSTLTFAATLASSSAFASFALVSLQLTHQLAFLPAQLSWSPFVLSGALALLSLYAVPLYRQRVLRLQRAEMEKWRVEARRSLSGWLDGEVEERQRRLAGVRLDMERQVLGDERIVQELRSNLVRLEREVVELREQIRLAQ